MTSQNQISAILVDDDEDTLEVFSECLQLENISVLDTCKNGLHAIKSFEKHRPDLVLLDIMMPNYDGFFAIEGIRNIAPNTKFLIITADISEKTVERLREMERIKILYKPCEVDDILTEIKALGSGEISVIIENDKG